MIIPTFSPNIFAEKLFAYERFDGSRVGQRAFAGAQCRRHHAMATIDFLEPVGVLNNRPQRAHQRLVLIGNHCSIVMRRPLK